MTSEKSGKGDNSSNGDSSMKSSSDSDSDIQRNAVKNNDNHIHNANQNNCIKSYVVLFYKYHVLDRAPLTKANEPHATGTDTRICMRRNDDAQNETTFNATVSNRGSASNSVSVSIVQAYRNALEELCTALELTGRILVAGQEGINGTLAGNNRHRVHAFTLALMGRDKGNSDSLTSTSTSPETPTSTISMKPTVCHILDTFWKKCDDIFKGESHVLTMSSPDDFKWSQSTALSEILFPDLYIKVVPELIGTGGVLLNAVSVDETSQGYLTPQEWHQMLENRQNGIDPADSILIDCRNTKEYQIGHFDTGALDPNTTTFAQFPTWVQQHSHLLEQKNVYMYCTGGIRCEKASAYIRKIVPSVQRVQHLKGGIHKYLEAYAQSSNGHWKGKNFIFDGRGAVLSANDNDYNSQECASDTIVGQCLYCSTPCDTYHPANVCTVCREPTLVCTSCMPQEVHCKNHFHLRTCYFTDLSRFTKDELNQQFQELRHQYVEISVGKKFKQKRKTLQKQMDKISQYSEQNQDKVQTEKELPESKKQCRNCGDVDCDGACWGFHSLKRKELLEKQHSNTQKKTRTTIKDSVRASANHRTFKQSQRQRLTQEMRVLQKPPSMHRCRITGIRVPPPCTRILSTSVKGKWCGHSALKVMQHEFDGVARDLDSILKHRLLRVNDTTIDEKEDDVVLKNMDIIQRLVHWHEPPILVPEKIAIKKVALPESVVSEYHLEKDDAYVWACDKPSTVPVHPTGPYLANSLTILVQAQEGLESITPCHRIDRVTSGLLICAPTVAVSRLIQGKLMDKAAPSSNDVRKLYVAKVKGHFPTTVADAARRLENNLVAVSSVEASDGKTSFLQVIAPILVQDPCTGIRIISNLDGSKPCTSRFHLIHCNDDDDTSVIVCQPVTGRGHQLRVHLQALGHPIVGDILYGGDEGSRKDGDSLYDKAVDAVLSSVVNHGKTKHEEFEGIQVLSPSDVKAAEEACRLCRKKTCDIVSSFTRAQLLGGGHSICLHALQYDITFRGKNDELLGTLKMSVDPPIWAKSINIDNLSCS